MLTRVFDSFLQVVDRRLRGETRLKLKTPHHAELTYEEVIGCLHSPWVRLKDSILRYPVTKILKLDNSEV